MSSSLESLAALTSQLVAIDSVNPSLVPGAAGEREIAEYVAGWLRNAGLDVTLDEVAPGRFNVVGIARGSGGGRSLMLNAHMDTVGIGGMTDPLTPRRHGERLHGRGSFDMKASLATIMLAGAHAVSAGWRGDLIITAVCDEEYASIGTARIAETLRADGAIVTEPTGLELCIAHKGFAWLDIETRGVAAHGSLAEEGVDAISAMGPILCGITALQARLDAAPPHPLLRTASVHASLISGGTELSTYPDRCTLSIERRTVPGETPEHIEAEFQELLAEESRTNPRFSASLTMGLTREPFEIAPDDPFTLLVAGAIERELGAPAKITGAFGWMDSALLSAAGIPTVIFGPTGAGAHADEEWIDLPSVDSLLKVLVAAAAEFCA
ncbi:MAG: M20/M25/M40 family metallo-hydrolase [Thermomicrobiales bacterium]